MYAVYCLHQYALGLQARGLRAHSCYYLIPYNVIQVGNYLVPIEAGEFESSPMPTKCDVAIVGAGPGMQI